MGVIGWCDGAAKTSSAGASYNLDTVEQGPTALAVSADGGCLDIFTLIYPFSPLSPSLWETARYRLKYCLKGPLNPKQPTNIMLKSAEHEISNAPKFENIKEFGPFPAQVSLKYYFSCS